MEIILGCADLDDITVSKSGYLEDANKIIESIKRIKKTLDEERKRLYKKAACCKYQEILEWKQKRNSNLAN